MKEFWRDKSARWLTVFDRVVRHRTRHYRTTFNENDGSDMYVLRDLARFCRANESAIALDANGQVSNELTYVLQGRREVYLRIMQQLKLSPETLTDIMLGPMQE